MAAEKTILQLLRLESQNWWYHKQLRNQGKSKLARKKENNSIKSDCKILRQAIKNKGFVQVYPNNGDSWALYYKHLCSLSGYAGSNILACCKKLDIPIEFCWKSDQFRTL